MIGDFIIELGLSDVTLVGNDTGGGLCQFVVDAYPEQVGSLVLTNCDAFDKFPPFPFTVVFALLRGPASIKLLFGQMQITALRHSPLGFGLLVTNPTRNSPTPGWNRVAGHPDPPRSRHPASQCGQNRSDRRSDPVRAVRQARDHRVGPADSAFKPHSASGWRSCFRTPR